MLSLVKGCVNGLRLGHFVLDFMSKAFTWCPCAPQLRCIVHGSQNIIFCMKYTEGWKRHMAQSQILPFLCPNSPHPLSRSNLGLDGGLVARVLNTCLFSSGCPVGCAQCAMGRMERFHWGNPALRLTTRSAGGKHSHAGACYLCIAWYSWSFSLCSIRHDLIPRYTHILFLGRGTKIKWHQNATDGPHAKEYQYFFIY